MKNWILNTIECKHTCSQFHQHYMSNFLPSLLEPKISNSKPGVNFINIIWAAFCNFFLCSFYVEFEFVIFRQEDLSIKAAHKMLVKLITELQKNCSYEFDLKKLLIKWWWNWLIYSFKLDLNKKMLLLLLLLLLFHQIGFEFILLYYSSTSLSELFPK